MKLLRAVLPITALTLLLHGSVRAQESVPVFPKITVDSSGMGDSPIAVELKRHINISTPRMDKKHVANFLAKEHVDSNDASPEQLEALGFRCDLSPHCTYRGRYSFRITDGQQKIKVTNYTYEVQLNLATKPLEVSTRRITVN